MIESTTDQKYLKKISESPQKQDLKLQSADNYLHNTYIVLCILNNLEII